VAEVARYLNEEFYRFPQPGRVSCEAGSRPPGGPSPRYAC
jgi:hypothetical protein